MMGLIDRISKIIKKGSQAAMSEREFLEQEIRKWEHSPQRQMMIKGELYYIGEHDICRYRRTAIGEGGELMELKNLPNHRVVDNQYALMVDQKVNYLLSKPLTFDTESAAYQKALGNVLGAGFARKLRNVGEDAINAGIGWMYIYYDSNGQLQFKRFEPFEIMPLWADAEHTELDCAVRLFQVETYTGKSSKLVKKVEVYKADRVERYVYNNNSLLPDVEAGSSNYIVIEDESGKPQGYGWGRVPLVAFKFNNKEMPLLKKIKSLQDGINLMLSTFENNMSEDSRNTILVLVNYDGQNLGEFRRNLAQYGAVKVRDEGSGGGDVRTLQVAVNADNYKVIVDIFKKALIENAMGFDSKDERLSGTPNQMNILSMYSNIELDANKMETEFQAAFEQLLYFVNIYLANSGEGDFSGDNVNVVFSRDMMMNTAEMIDNCAKSAGIISDETIIANHPWVTDPKAEIERLKAQQEETDPYKEAFVQGQQSDGGIDE